MNITVGKTNTSKSNRSWVRALGAGGGVVLALGAALAFAPWSSSSGESKTIVRAVPAAIELVPESEPQLVYYLVSSQQEAMAIQSAISSQASVLSVPQANVEYRTIVVDTAESEAMAAYMAQTAMAYAPEMRVVDLRNR